MAQSNNQNSFRISPAQLTMMSFPELACNPNWASRGPQITAAFLIFLELCGEKRSSYKDHEIESAHISVESIITCTFISSSLNIQYKTTSSFQAKTDSTSKKHYWSTHPMDTENCPDYVHTLIASTHPKKFKECSIDITIIFLQTHALTRTWSSKPFLMVVLGIRSTDQPKENSTHMKTWHSFWPSQTPGKYVTCVEGMQVWSGSVISCSPSSIDQIYVLECV